MCELLSRWYEYALRITLNCSSLFCVVDQITDTEK